MPDNGSVLTDQSESKRDRSTIEFPYLDLEDAVELARGIHTIGGTSCQKDQLAAHFDQAAGGGGFSLRLGAAKMYGLLTYERGSITLTDLGIKAADPEQEKAARVDAFLTIPLYRTIYEKFRGTALPPAAGLESAMVSAGVAPKQKEKARQVFMRSAKQAGFFEFGSNRLVQPSIGKRDRVDEDKKPKSAEEHKRPPHKEHDTYHPFVQGLLKTLPEAEAEWPLEARKKWLQAAATMFDLIYTDSGESTGTIKIEIA